MKLEAENISFHYNSKRAQIVQNVSLVIEAGERIGLTAPSGFGKTTLCKILAGYEKPDSGRVLLDGRPLEQYRNRCPVQLIWQHPEQSVDPEWKMKKVLWQGQVEDAALLKRLGIEESWLDRFPSELSGGELQRFCIARALGANTKILLADEITTMMDLVTQSEIWNVLLEETARRNIGMLVVSHSEGLLRQVCTRRLELKRQL